MSDRIVSDPAAPWQPDELTRPLDPSPPPSPGAPADRAAAQAKIDAIYADQAHPYHRGERGAVQAMRQLFQAVHADRAPGALPGARPTAPGGEAAPLEWAGDRGIPLIDQSLDHFSTAMADLGAGPIGQTILDSIASGVPLTDSFIEALPTFSGSPDATAATLQTEWGAAYEDNLALARWMVQSLRPDLIAALERSGRGNSPAAAKFFLAEGARNLIRSVMADRTNGYHKGDRQWVNDMQRWHQLAATGGR